MDESDPQTYAIIGAAMEVHSVLGTGFLESVYHEALTCELRLRGIPFTSEVGLPIKYKGEKLLTFFRADLICYGDVVVELKALRALSGVEESQLLNYLKATGIDRGLLFNFGPPRLEVKRMKFTPR
ncbi:MAG: GxxExxY protein [Flavobacteriales bacterium]